MAFTYRERLYKLVYGAYLAEEANKYIRVIRNRVKYKNTNILHGDIERAKRSNRFLAKCMEMRDIR